jgi:hypothetical protein
MKRAPKARAVRAIAGAAVVVLASLGSALASNIAIGNPDG